MHKLLGPLLFVAILAVFTPTPGYAAISCSANCPNGSCWCLFCSCGCSGGNPQCGDQQASVAHVSQATLGVIEPFKGETGEVDLSSIKIARPASHGVVTVEGDGRFLYSPDPDFTGLDSFTFSACNFKGDCDLATVLVDVVPEN
ncbi:MAG TPA: Ig-like domain-containing protein [Thermoanaerobaculia bacterium]|jgi:hypothetical protein|nr:Ig-like domain-containing protein [Thermoanaerobaculia bacterium]